VKIIFEELLQGLFGVILEKTKQILQITITLLIQSGPQMMK